MTNVTVMRLVSDFGEVDMSVNLERVVKAAKVRKDGQPDLRSKTGKLARMAIDAELLRSQPRF